MKKIWMIFCFSLLFCSTVFFGCENKENQNEEIVLRIANWEEYLDEGGWDEDETIDLDEKTKILGRENMVDDFESWYEKTYGEKVRVEYSTFGTNEDLYNQMTLGDTFDLVCPSEYMIMKLMKEKKLEPFSEDFFDTSKKENYYSRGVSPYIKNVFDLNDRTVEEIMVPRVDMVAIEDTTSIDEVKNIFIREQYSRIPVYHEDKDHIIGIIYERDFFEAMAKNIELKNVKQLMRNVLFVNKKMTVDALIKTLQESKTHMAIVSGEYNDTLGLVTMEDALEEIVGEIYDEHDEGSVKQKLLTKINDNTYMVDGDMFVSDMFEEIGLGEAPEGASKLSTWMFESQEDLPKIGDKMTYISCFTDQNENGEYEDYAKKIVLEIVEVDDRRIETVKVTVDDATEEEVEQFEESKEDE